MAIRGLLPEHEEKLISLLQEGETVYEVARLSECAVYVIGEKVDDIGLSRLDLSGCIEDTLHRLLESDSKKEEIYAILGAEPDDTNGSLDDDGTDTYYIDRGYVIHGFYPIYVSHTGVDYKRPVFEYTLHYWDKIICTHLTIYQDATDDEILEAVSDLVGIRPKEFIVEDMKSDGSMFGVKSLVNDNETFLLIQNLVFCNPIPTAA